MKINVSMYQSGKWLVNEEYSELLEINNILSPEDLWNLKGESVKNFLKERGTERAFLDLKDGQKIETYVKRYLPLPLKEYFKAAISSKPLFKIGAIHEWEAIIAFHNESIPTMIPIAAGMLPDGRSVNITLGITDYTRASDIFNAGPSRNERISLISKIAELAGRMHAAGFAHQDFYLVHLFVTDVDKKVLPIDLQRLIMGKQFSARWQIKDLAQLLYSAKPYVSKTDILRFWKKYTSIAGGNLYKNKSFINRVISKAQRIKNRSDRKKKRKRNK
jgi:heptose I phosphotransferase